MDVYRQAGDIVRAVREGHGTAKALCLRKEMQKKKQTYAVVCETLRHYDLLLDVLEQAEFFQFYPRANRELAVCMAYDVVLGKGVNTNRDSTAQAIQKSAPYLREAYWHVKKHHVIPPRVRDNFDENGENNNNNDNRNKNKNSNGNQHQSAGDDSSMMLERRIPRYARVNTLKIDVESLVERLRRAAAKRARDAEDNNNDNDNNNNNKHSHGNRNSKGFRTLPEFTIDPIIPSLLVFPPGTDLHAHPAVRSGQLILQDRASCLPVCVLLNAVEVCTSASVNQDEIKPLEYVVDACAAPGNKTTQIAALGAPHIKVMALERDEKRADLLYKRVQSLGAGDYVNVVHMDFFEMTSADREAAEAILLDPSCSASGVLTRVDVSLVQQRQYSQVQKDHTNTNNNNNNNNNTIDNTIETDNNNNNNNNNNNEDTGGAIAVEEQGAEFASNVDRVQSLARLQRKLLAHALLSFDNCRTVVYSTCSLHEEENEAVVRQVLLDSRVQSRGWTLSHIMPNTWKTRGHKTAEDTLPLDYTIRCDPVVDATNGFYVARFDRTCEKGKKTS